MSLDTLEDRFWEKVAIGTDAQCWPWLACRKETGYGQIYVSKGVIDTAHRVAYELANGPIPRGQHVRHSCDYRICCNPNHLLLGTIRDNNEDKQVRNRQAKGSRQSTATRKSWKGRQRKYPPGIQYKKLDDYTASLCPILYESGMTYRQIADMMDLRSPSTVYHVVRGISWKKTG